AASTTATPVSVIPWTTYTVTGAPSVAAGNKARTVALHTTTKEETIDSPARVDRSRTNTGASTTRRSVGPSNNPNGSLLENAIAVHTNPSAAAKLPTKIQRR